jgi:hypothetical protein
MRCYTSMVQTKTHHLVRNKRPQEVEGKPVTVMDTPTHLQPRIGASTPAKSEAPSVGVSAPCDWQWGPEMINLRDWLKAALEKAGGITTGSGIGGCQVDVELELEGHRFNVSVSPVFREHREP